MNRFKYSEERSSPPAWFSLLLLFCFLTVNYGKTFDDYCISSFIHFLRGVTYLLNWIVGIALFCPKSVHSLIAILRATLHARSSSY